MVSAWFLGCLVHFDNISASSNLTNSLISGFVKSTISRRVNGGVDDVLTICTDTLSNPCDLLTYWIHCYGASIFLYHGFFIDLSILLCFRYFYNLNNYRRISDSLSAFEIDLEAWKVYWQSLVVSWNISKYLVIISLYLWMALLVNRDFNKVCFQLLTVDLLKIVYISHCSFSLSYMY